MDGVVVSIAVAAPEIPASPHRPHGSETARKVPEVEELVRSEEARTGVRVRVADGSRIPRLLGAEGTIERIYMSSERTALHVRLDDGRWQLMWPEELEALREDPGGS